MVLHSLIVISLSASAFAAKQLDLGFKRSKDPIVLVEPTPAPQKTPKKIGGAFVDSLHAHMPIAKIQSVLGAGRMIGRSEDIDGLVETYEWKTDSEDLVISFRNGELIQKSYTGKTYRETRRKI